ncbi:PHD-finger [Teladorsagia circumcincta]|uniref:PHD-finger n=1 Tax=Teladorsagia circumcincta TaxID=45464 RepID=A0A2G9V2Q7_TELCI|nr:PHD-finger [Teladorsagia circumcincta]
MMCFVYLCKDYTSKAPNSELSHSNSSVFCVAKDLLQFLTNGHGPSENKDAEEPICSIVRKGALGLLAHRSCGFTGDCAGAIRTIYQTMASHPFLDMFFKLYELLHNQIDAIAESQKEQLFDLYVEWVKSNAGAPRADLNRKEIVRLMEKVRLDLDRRDIERQDEIYVKLVHLYKKMDFIPKEYSDTKCVQFMRATGQTSEAVAGAESPSKSGSDEMSSSRPAPTNWLLLHEDRPPKRKDVPNDKRKKAKRHPKPMAEEPKKTAAVGSKKGLKSRDPIESAGKKNRRPSMDEKVFTKVVRRSTRQPKKGKRSKKRLAKNTDDASSSPSLILSEDQPEIYEYDEDDDARYCYCNRVGDIYFFTAQRCANNTAANLRSFDLMIACDGQYCEYGGWFHMECVGLTEAPPGKWYCRTCIHNYNDVGSEINNDVIVKEEIVEDDGQYGGPFEASTNGGNA